MSAQQRTLDDLKIGVNVQIDKGGHIRYRQQPQMGLPSIEIIDKSIVAQLKRENERLSPYAEFVIEKDYGAEFDAWYALLTAEEQDNG